MIPKTKELLQKLSEIRARALKNVRQSCPRQMIFKEYRLDVVKN
jgi:hypothetical protein